MFVAARKLCQADGGLGLLGRSAGLQHVPAPAQVFQQVQHEHGETRPDQPVCAQVSLRRAPRPDRFVHDDKTQHGIFKGVAGGQT